MIRKSVIRQSGDRADVRTLGRRITAGAVLGLVVGLAATLGGDACKPTSVPEVLDGAAPVVSGLCTWLEGITDSGTLITICATAEEILAIASLVASFLPSRSPDAGACTVIPTTSTCATKNELGRAILEIVAQRRARLSLDGGPIP